VAALSAQCANQTYFFSMGYRVMKTHGKLSGCWGGLVSLLAVVTALAATSASADFCFRDNYGRGVGKVPAACADADRALDEGLCYKKCEAGFDGRGTSCVKDCPAGMKDDGALLCIKPTAASSYGVGAGYPWKIGDRVGDYEPAGVRCRQEVNNSGVGCTKEGLIWYPNCKTGFKKAGALLCVPEPLKCPDGFADLAGSCGRPTTNRGVGIIPNSCGSGKQLDAGLCYDNCKPNFAGAGPMCNQQCPASSPVACAATLGCASSQADCGKALLAPLSTAWAVMADQVKDINARNLNKTAGNRQEMASLPVSYKGDISETQFVDLFNGQFLGTTYVFAYDEIKEIFKAMKGLSFSPAKVDPVKLAAVAKAYKRTDCRM
jgi:hypothetical protein